MLFASYFYLRLQTKAWPPNGVEKPAVLVPVLLTVALVLTSVAMQHAWIAARAGARIRAWWSLAIAGVVQFAYLVWQAHDFVDDVPRQPPSGSERRHRGVALFGGLIATQPLAASASRSFAQSRSTACHRLRAVASPANQSFAAAPACASPL